MSKTLQPLVEKHYRVAELAFLLTLSERYLWDEIAQGNETKGDKGIYPTVRKGKTVLVPVSSVNKWLATGTG